MISFKEALTLGGEDLKGLKQDLKKRVEETKQYPKSQNFSSKWNRDNSFIFAKVFG